MSQHVRLKWPVRVKVDTKRTDDEPTRCVDCRQPVYGIASLHECPKPKLTRRQRQRLAAQESL